MTLMDPRMRERRRQVAESNAKLDLRRLLWIAAAAVVVGGVIWLLTSPLLSIRQIVVHGAVQSDVAGVLAEQQVVEGRPLIAIRADDVAALLEEDPWVQEAAVELVFPDLIEVTVSERRGVAWVRVGPQWGLVSDDAVLVSYAEQPDPAEPLLQLPSLDPGLGSQVDDRDVQGAVVFVAGLPSHLAESTMVRDEAGELWATVAEREIRLGNPTDMMAKAAAVAAVIDLSSEGVIDVIAPSRPAVWGTGEADDAQEPGGEGEDEADPQQEGEG
jgi:hypothetical protein